MNQITKMKKTIRVVMIVFTIILAFILLNLVIHLNRTKEFNEQVRVIDNSSETTDIVVDIYPRAQTTDSWEKQDFLLGTIYAKIYEASIINCSQKTMKDWSLRIDIQDDCWISNAWNGTVEIHQFIDDKERVQELSLQNYKKKDLTLRYYVSGQDLMIPLTKGDYIIYYPCRNPSISEEEIESTDFANGEVAVGFIFYSISGNTDLTEYELVYKLEQSIWAGTEPKIFLVIFPIWCIAMLIAVIISVLTIASEKKIITQSSITVEFIDAIAGLIDTKNKAGDGYSISIAECARNIAKGLGMKKIDCDNVYYAALVRDIGKLQLPDYLVKKVDNLTQEEQEQLKRHTIKGSEILGKCAAIPIMSEAALSHHERYDGKGYPYGKSGEEIPLIGRIIYLAESYIHMSSLIVNYDDEARKSVVEALNKEKGISFDPMLVDVLIDIIDGTDFQIEGLR